jgi:hypothetical protein
MPTTDLCTPLGQSLTLWYRQPATDRGGGGRRYRVRRAGRLRL